MALALPVADTTDAALEVAWTVFADGFALDTREYASRDDAEVAYLDTWASHRSSDAPVEYRYRFVSRWEPIAFDVNVRGDVETLDEVVHHETLPVLLRAEYRIAANRDTTSVCVLARAKTRVEMARFAAMWSELGVGVVERRYVSAYCTT